MTNYNDNDGRHQDVAPQLVRLAIMDSTVRPPSHETPSTVAASTKNRVDALTALAGGAGALFIAITAYVYVSDRDHCRAELAELRGDLKDEIAARTTLQTDNTQLQIAISSIRQYQEAHVSESKFWIEKIEGLRGQVVGNHQSIALIGKNPNARVDPFTGTEGRALEGRIEVLEMCCRDLRAKP